MRTSTAGRCWLQQRGSGLAGERAEFDVQVGDLVVHGLVPAGQAP